MRIRRAKSISPSIASIVVVANGVASNSATINVGSTAPDCTTSATQLSCSGTIALVAGSYQFTVTEYDASNGTGNVLGIGTTAATLTPGATLNVPITLDGIVANVVLSVTQTTFVTGTAASATVDVLVEDGDGNVIVGPGNFIDANGNPLTVTIAASDPAHAATLSATSFTSPGATTATLTYSGATEPAGSAVALTASVPGITLPSTPLVAFLPAGTSGSNLYVITQTSFPVSTLEELAPSGSVVAMLPNEFALDFAYDTSGNLYVLSNGGTSISEYAPNSGTMPRLVREIGGSNTLLQGGSLLPESAGLFASSIAIDPSGNIYASGKIGHATAVLVFGATQSGNVAPAKALEYFPDADLEVDAQGDLYGGYFGEIAFASQAALAATSGYGTFSGTAVTQGNTGANAGQFALDAQGNAYAYVGTQNGSSTVNAAGTLNVLASPSGAQPFALLQSLSIVTGPVLTNVEACCSNQGGILYDSSGRVDIAYNFEQGLAGSGVNSFGAAIAQYDLSSTNDAPVGEIVPSVGLPSLGYVVRLRNVPGGLIAAMNAGPNGASVETFTPQQIAAGNATPVSTTILSSLVGFPAQVAVGPTGDVLVSQVIAQGVIGGGQAEPCATPPVANYSDVYTTLAIFAPGTAFTTQPVRSIIAQAGLAQPAEDAQGNVYALDCVGNVDEFAHGATGLVLPARTVPAIVPINSGESELLGVGIDGTLAIASSLNTATQGVYIAAPGASAFSAVQLPPSYVTNPVADSAGNVYYWGYNQFSSPLDPSIYIVPKGQHVARAVSSASITSNVVTQVAVDATSLYVYVSGDGNIYVVSLASLAGSSPAVTRTIPVGTTPIISFAPGP